MEASGLENKRKLIGYTCPYIPVEILSATGYRPYCLLHGRYDLMQLGTRYARIDACPLVRANISHILQTPDRYAALVGASGCDMARRLFDIIQEHTDIPVLMINMPRTDNFQIYLDEINWLINELNRMFDVYIPAVIDSHITKWEETRDCLRKIDKRRYDPNFMLSTTDFHTLTRAYYQGTPMTDIGHSHDLPDKPRIYMIGSEISYESDEFLRTLEHEFHIIGDLVGGLSHFLSIHIKNISLDSMLQGYFHQPCIYRRPNDNFYNYLSTQLKQRSCDGLIGFTLDYCDAYEFEMHKIEQIFNLPMLRLRTDYAFEKISQLATRIAAFRELLCSRI